MKAHHSTALIRDFAATLWLLAVFALILRSIGAF